MNTCHFDDAKLALDAGKHCLLEKVRSPRAQAMRALTPAGDAQRSGVESSRCPGEGEEGVSDGG